MSARERILQRIRDGHAKRTTPPTPNPQPKPRTLGCNLMEHWSEQVGQHFGAVHTLAQGEALSEAIAKIAAPQERIGYDACLADQDWSSAAAVFELAEVPMDRPVFVTRAHAAVAETGSVLMSGGPQRRLINAYLVRHLIVVVSAQTMLESLEDAAKNIAEIDERQVVLMTGPSATGDIGGELILGAQAADRLDYIVVP